MGSRVSGSGKSIKLCVTAILWVIAAGGAPAVADEVPGEPVVVPSSSSAATTPAAAPTYKTNDGDDWKFDVGLYGWFPFMSGAMRFQDQIQEVDVTFDNLWKQLHMAFFLDVEIQKGNFGFFGDITYARLWQRQQQTANLNVKTDINLVLFDFAFYYQVLSRQLGPGPLPPRLRLQPYVGGRYFYNGIDAQLRRTIGPSTEVNPRLNTAAPILGLRGFLDIDEHWNISFAGDGGGFGVSDMHKTWLAELLGGYRFRRQRVDLNLQVGYKGVGIDQRPGDKEIAGDLIFHGPVLRLGVEF